MDGERRSHLGQQLVAQPQDVDRGGLEVVRGVKNRGFGLEVSDLRGDLDAAERVEIGKTCLGGE